MAGTLILLSGGMNSTIALYQVLKDEDCKPPYHALTFSYRQNDFETCKAEDIFKKAIAPFVSKECIAVSNLDDLPKHTIISIPQAYNSSEIYIKLLYLLTRAAEYAIVENLISIVVGISPVDIDDIKLAEDFISSMETTIRLAAGLAGLYRNSPKLITPHIEANKGDLFKTANALGILQIVIDETTSCKNFDEEFHQYEWGKGCGECKDCREREYGWKAYQKDAERWKAKEKEPTNQIKIDDTIYTGVGNPARWMILERDSNGKSTPVTTHGKQRLFTLPELAWDWIKNQNTLEKFYTVTGQDTARHIMIEQGGD